MNKEEDSYCAFCDGACSGNPGPGGWGAVINLGPDRSVVEIGGPSTKTTNNQMELLAAIKTLEFFQSQTKAAQFPLTLYTDSKYVLGGMTSWADGWSKRGWLKSDGSAVMNQPEWKRLLLLRDAHPKKIHWTYVPGHCGIAGNDRADQIAVCFSKHQEIDLYAGSFEAYSVALFPVHSDDPTTRTKAKAKKASSKGKALFYLSLVAGKLQKHSSWAECEAATKGRSGAKFKKICSLSEESAVRRQWGV